MKHGLTRRDDTHWRHRTRSAGAIAHLALVAFVLALGCSSSTPPAAKCGGAPACASGASCIDDGSDAGPSCQKACTGQADCPFNSYCNDGQPTSWCAPSTYAVPQGAGQWGALCSGGCDTADSFDCYGVLPTDPNALCTLPDCLYDSDCPGGWWCAMVDATPNHTTKKRTFGLPPRAWCLPRQYCATCQMDHDCAKAADGTQQHCVQDSAHHGFCSPQCGSNATCPLDATCQLQWAVCAQTTCKQDGDCQARGGAEKCFAGVCQLACKKDVDCPASNGMAQHCGQAGACVTQACQSDDDCPPTSTTFQHCNAGACTPECSTAADCNAATGDQTCTPLSVCAPRAGACVGDGTFCSPCRSDGDCSAGYCLNAQYSTERFCSTATAAGVQCSSTASPLPGTCPKFPPGAEAEAFGCTTAADSAIAPANQCVGEVPLGTAQGQGQVMYVTGCWSAH